MAAKLFSKTGDCRGLELELASDREAIVGRDPASDLVIERPLMSSRHAKIFYDDDAGRYVLEDLDSLNGIDLDGDRVTGSERLGHLHVITFAGSYDFLFFDSERCAQRHPEPLTDPTMPAAQPSPPAPPRKATASPTAVDDRDEVTAIESDPVALPGFLARRADALTTEPPGESAIPDEITSIERDPIGLPGILAHHADKAHADKARADKARADKARADKARADKARADTPQTEPQTDDENAATRDSDATGHTMHEKLPVALPGILARRAEEAADRTYGVQKHETVDLAQIEKLIAAEEATEQREREALPALGLHLIVTESGGNVRQYPLVEGENIIGRGARVQVELKYPDLSRRHASLTVAGEEITLRDLGSRNRTFVDDQALDPEVDVNIKPGARLRFGSVEVRLALVGND